MKWVTLTLLVACRRDAPPASTDDPAYVRDVDRICNVVAWSGAQGMELAERTYLTATWLGSNLESSAGRALLAAIQPLDNANKANALQQEATRVAIPNCPLVTELRGP
jgi:hypothetical protein